MQKNWPGSPLIIDKKKKEEISCKSKTLAVLRGEPAKNLGIPLKFYSKKLFMLIRP